MSFLPGNGWEIRKFLLFSRDNLHTIYLDIFKFSICFSVSLSCKKKSLQIKSAYSAHLSLFKQAVYRLENRCNFHPFLYSSNQNWLLSFSRYFFTLCSFCSYSADFLDWFRQLPMVYSSLLPLVFLCFVSYFSLKFFVPFIWFDVQDSCNFWIRFFTLAFCSLLTLIRSFVAIFWMFSHFRFRSHLCQNHHFHQQQPILDAISSHANLCDWLAVLVLHFSHLFCYQTH